MVSADLALRTHGKGDFRSLFGSLSPIRQGVWIPAGVWTVPWRTQLNTVSFERLPHRLIVTAETLSQELAGPAIFVEPESLMKPFPWYAALLDLNTSAP
jgi:hypothetical protein